MEQVFDMLDVCREKGQQKRRQESRPLSQNHITSVTAAPQGEGRLSQPYHATWIISFGKK